MTEPTSSPLGNVITIDDEGIKSHLDRVVRGTVEETLNALLDAEADRLCNARRYGAVRRDATPVPAITNATCRPRLWPAGAPPGAQAGKGPAARHGGIAG